MGGSHSRRGNLSRRIGKAASHDQLLSSPKFNGMMPLAPPIDRHIYFNGYHGIPSSNEELMMSSPYATAPRSMSMRLPNSRRGGYSSSTLGPESGFSSKASSNLDNANHSYSTPSSPQCVMRRKPPPKPPRMRSYNVDNRLTSTDTLLRTPSPSPSRSVDVFTLKTSIVDVTNALDSTLSRSFVRDEPRAASPMVKRYNPSGEDEVKVCNILAQTKEILAFELDPEPVLTYLCDHGVINRTAEAQIKRLRNKQVRCEQLLDVITSKGQDEFMVFCTALKSVGSQSYLADFLLVLDALVHIATTKKLKPNDTERSPSKMSFAGGQPCVTCSCNNNLEDMDIAADSGSFEIEISYIHRDSGQKRSIRDIAAMKHRKRPLSMTSEDFELLEETDRYIPMISVSLYNQCLMDGGINTIANILQQYMCVRELSLVKNHIDTAESMGVLARALEKNRSLAHLDIRLNRIGDEGSFHLAQVISKHTTLRMLNVTSTGLCGVGCSQLVYGVTRSSSLVELDLGFNEMTEESCESLSRCLTMNNTLCKLRMRCNSITPYGARCIFKGLKRNARVNFVDISRNRIKDESIFVLAEVLLLNRTLKGINLENCGITGEGCAALARALKTNMSLKTLDMSMNSIGDAGAQAISEGLKYNQSIQTLCLNMCNIANKGFLHILDAMRFNTTIKTLKLCYNKIGKHQRYSDVWLTLKSMPEVCLSNSDFHPATEPSSPTESSGSGTLKLSIPSSPLSAHRATLYSSSPTPRSPRTPLSPSSPISPLTSTLRRTLSHSMSTAKDPVELMYEILCEVLQQNKDLKVLLWGNNFDDVQDSQTDSDIGSTTGEDLSYRQSLV